MGKRYKIYLFTHTLEFIGGVNTIDEVIGVLSGLGDMNFIVIEHDKEKHCDNPITFEVRKLLEENNVSRGITKVYKRKK